MSRLLWLALIVLAGCGAKTPPPPPPAPLPGPLMAGVATAPLDAPVGTPTGGYSKSRSVSDPASPWAVKHSATTGIHTLPTARALALSDGLTRTVIVRIDTCLSTATLRWRAEAALRAAGHDATLLLSATHTHGGPARYMHPAPAEGTGGIDPASVAMDVFDPEIEDRMARGIAAAAAGALTSLVPASMGVATIDASVLNRDRRCENNDLYGPEYRDTTLTVMRLDEVDATGAPVRPLTGLIHFAVHGTVLGGENPLLSTDAPGALELQGSDAVGVPLLFLQGAAGDVSPSVGGAGFSGFQALERFGSVGAVLVKDAWMRAAPATRPERAALARFEVPVNVTRAAIGYAQGEFSEFGAVMCGFGAGGCPATVSDPKDVLCLPLARRPFVQTTFVSLKLEGVVITTLPGEPTTAIGDRVKQAALATPGVTHALVAGYAMDHFGYLLEGPDFLRLGYEPSVSPWGPRFGDFAVAKATESVSKLGEASPAATQPEARPYTPRAGAESINPPVAREMPVDLPRLTTARFAFEGGDPALGAPEVSLEREGPGGFEQAMASPIRPVRGGPDVILRYAATPDALSDPNATFRAHLWTAEWETLQATPLGTYRFVARGSALRRGSKEAYTLVSAPFVLSATSQVGAAATATTTTAGQLQVQLRFPPNPTVTDARGGIVGHYRMRDADSNPQSGALVRGGHCTATLTLPGGGTRSETLDWDDAAQAYLHTGAPLSNPGRYELRIDVGAAQDGAGNTNGAVVQRSFQRQ